jgi:hypothetical protein
VKQFRKIFNFELKYYLKNKVFAGVTVFLVLLIAVVMFFPRIMEAFKSGDDSTESAADLPVMLIKPDLSENTELITKIFAPAFPDYDVRCTDEELDSVKKKILSGDAECAFVMNGMTSYTYYVNNLSMYDMNTEVADELLRDLYRVNAMVENGMTAEQAGSVMSVQIEKNTESLGVDQMQNYWYTYIMIFALYMVILLYGQMVATNVATEKSSRAMELLITSAKPVSMMFGKVIASCFAGLIQLVAIFGTALVCFSLNKPYWGENMIINSIFNMPPALLGYMLIFFVLGFLIYAFLYGAIGSTASKLEDINTSVMPITMLFVIAFIVVVYSFSAGTVDTLLMKVCSFVPFTSPMAMFTRIAMSTVPVYEIVISVAVLAASVIGVGYVSAKIYRVGVLLYGTTPKLGAIIKAVWKA